jgi:hypothetical protein
MPSQVVVAFKVDESGAVTGIRNLSDETADLERRLESADQASERMEQSVNRAGGSSSNAAQFIFSLGDATQDAQFGLAGVANNATFAAETFTQLVKDTGSTKSAIAALGTAVVGPAGLVLALQALLALGPQLAQWFNDRTGEAEALDKALGEAASSLLEVTRESTSFGVATARQAETARSEAKKQLESAQDTLETLQQVQQALREGARAERFGESVTAFAPGGQRGAERRQRELSGLLDAVGLPSDAELSEVRSRIDETQIQIDAYGKAIEQLKTIQSTLEAEAILENLFASIGLDPTGDGTSGGSRAVEQVAAAKELAVETLDNVRSIQDLTGDLSARGLDSGEAVRKIIEDFRARSYEQVTRAIGTFQRALDGIESDSARDQLAAFIERLKETRDELALAEGKALDVGPALEQGLANSIVSVTNALASGDNVAAALLESVGGLAQRLGKMLIGFGVAALNLQTLITNPIGAIAAGTALVALGAAAKSAASSVVDDATGGGRGARTRDRSPQGGGRLAVDAPTRARGGPGMGGSLYRTHGLGSNEYFVPNRDGMFVTRDQMQRAQPSPVQRVDVRTRSSLDITARADLFQLETRLREAAEINNKFRRSGGEG